MLILLLLFILVNILWMIVSLVLSPTYQPRWPQISWLVTVLLALLTSGHLLFRSVGLKVLLGFSLLGIGTFLKNILENCVYLVLFSKHLFIFGSGNFWFVLEHLPIRIWCIRQILHANKALVVKVVRKTFRIPWTSLCSRFIEVASINFNFTILFGISSIYKGNLLILKLNQLRLCLWLIAP